MSTQDRSTDGLRSGGAFEPNELAELLESLYAGGDATSAFAALESAQPVVTAELLVAGASVLRRHAAEVRTPPNRAPVDIAVAGPRDESLLDLTIGAAILVAACDGTAAQSGLLADRTGGEALLHALGLPVQETAQAAYDALERSGSAWLPGERFHPGPTARVLRLGAASPWLGLLGPLVNPSAPSCHVVGVRDPAHTEPLARALGLLGAESALVLTYGGFLSSGASTETSGHRWVDGRVTSFSHPASTRPVDLSPSGGATVDAARLESVFEGLKGPLADALALNAGAALWIGGVLPTFAEACRWARSRLAQKVELSDFCVDPPVTSPIRTSPVPDSTSRRSPHLPRGGTRRPRDRRG
ncbi:MAG: hypothetical protein Q8P18_29015 [Pseudomonadota bacterium]|nr:hypothetical protein [Pseudomonadota bacterium]